MQLNFADRASALKAIPGLNNMGWKIAGIHPSAPTLDVELPLSLSQTLSLGQKSWESFEREMRSWFSVTNYAVCRTALPAVLEFE